MWGLRHQRTLGAPIELTGVGYWTGRQVTVRLRPAPAGYGRVFWLRSAGRPNQRIPVKIEHRVEVPRRTSLATAGARVEMVEHLLAVLSAFRVDNCSIELDTPELPAFDGSSLPIAQALESVGTREQSLWQPALIIDRTVRVEEGDAWIEARAATEPGLYLEYQLDYGPGPIGKQQFGMWLSADTFVRQVAPARSFLLEQEAAELRRRGLGAHVTYQDVLVFGREGPLGNSLRFPDECVRHKLLDLVGDLALCGADIHGRIIAHRSGHRLNARMVERLCRSCATHRKVRAA